MAIVVVTATAVVGWVVPASAHTAPLTKAHGTAIAKKINLRSSDFPGYSITPYHETKTDKAIGKRLLKCVGGTPDFVDVTSPNFDSSDGASTSSEVEFVPTRADGKRDARLLNSAHGRTCLEHALGEVSTEAGLSDVHATLAPITEPPVAGLDVIFGFQITITFTTTGGPGTLYGWDIDFLRGNAEVSVTEAGTANEPQSVLTAPLNTLIARAKQQVPAAGLPTKHS